MIINAILCIRHEKTPALTIQSDLLSNSRMKEGCLVKDSGKVSLNRTYQKLLNKYKGKKFPNERMDYEGKIGDDGYEEDLKEFNKRHI